MLEEGKEKDYLDQCEAERENSCNLQSQISPSVAIALDGNEYPHHVKITLPFIK